jgi:hypothetical protein
MVYQGTVQNGVVVFPAGVQLPEGSPVRVELMAETPHERPAKDDILFRMGDYAIETGIPDLGANIDHYLYGHPKKVADG